VRVEPLAVCLTCARLAESAGLGAVEVAVSGPVLIVAGPGTDQILGVREDPVLHMDRGE